MSLRQDQLIAKLPKNGYNISKTAREVGYTEQSSKAGSLYNSLRKKIDKAFNADQVKADILKAEKDFTKAEDHSNRARMLELRCKVLGLGKETPTQVNVAIVDAIDREKARDILDDTPIDSDTPKQDIW